MFLVHKSLFYMGNWKKKTRGVVRTKVRPMKHCLRTKLKGTPKSSVIKISRGFFGHATQHMES